MTLDSPENIRSKTSKRTRRIVLPDGKVRFAATDPKEIAAELRSKSKLGAREAKLRDAEAKLGR